jgi:phage terminase large subunit-like protein
MFKAAQQDKTGRWEAFHFSSMENPYISADALSEISTDMTALAYRQEILAEDVEDVPGALWTRALIDKGRVAVRPEGLVRVVIGVDPPPPAPGAGPA